MNKQIKILWKNKQQKEDFRKLNQPTFGEVTKKWLWNLIGYLIFAAILWGTFYYGIYRLLAVGY